MLPWKVAVRARLRSCASRNRPSGRPDSATANVMRLFRVCPRLSSEERAVAVCQVSAYGPTTKRNAPATVGGQRMAWRRPWKLARWRAQSRAAVWSRWKQQATTRLLGMGLPRPYRCITECTLTTTIGKIYLPGGTSATVDPGAPSGSLVPTGSATEAMVSDQSRSRCMERRRPLGCALRPLPAGDESKPRPWPRP
jgi:hypothetical protein